MNVPLTYRPLLLGGVFKAVGTAQNLFASRGPARSAHEAVDMSRWAGKFGVPLTMPPAHPMRSVEALRATLAVGIDPEVVAAFFRAYWVEGRAISSPEVISDIVSSAGHDAASVLARIEEPALKDDLRKRTDEAIALGIFGVPAWIVDGTHLYWGQDRIPFVEGVRRELEPVVSPARASTIDVYWDFSSPFSYLGAMRVEALAARTGAKVEWHPILLGGLFRALGTPDVPLATFSEAKARYVLKDLHRWAEYWQLPFKFNSHFPVNTLKALRLYIALSDDRRAHFRDATYRAVWADDRDIADDGVLADCVGDEAAFREATAHASRDEVKAALRASTERAAARGVFGVPTLIVGDELFWGQDRLELALCHPR
jgi:2-hydroxychromene-2-carboxylate isomerase